MESPWLKFTVKNNQTDPWPWVSWPGRVGVEWPPPKFMFLKSCSSGYKETGQIEGNRSAIVEIVWNTWEFSSAAWIPEVQNKARYVGGDFVFESGRWRKVQSTIRVSSPWLQKNIQLNMRERNSKQGRTTYDWITSNFTTHINSHMKSLTADDGQVRTIPQIFKKTSPVPGE
jgi:hypothetical protein